MLEHGCVACAVHDACSLHGSPTPKKPRCRGPAAEPVVDPAHPQSNVELKHIAVGKLRVLLAEAEAAHKRVSGAQVREIAQSINVTERHLHRLLQGE